MIRFTSLLLLLSAACVFAANPEIETQWIELPVGPVAPAVVQDAVPAPAPALTFPAAAPVYAVQPDVGAVTKSFSQPVNYEYRLEAQPAIVMQYSGQTQMANVWAGSLLTGNLGFANSVSFGVDLSRTLTAAIRLETDSHVDSASQMDFANRLELVGTNKKVRGLVANATAGLASITDPTGAIIDQRYARMELVQDIPLVPLHVRVAPSVSSEHGATSSRLLAGLESAVLVDVTHQTVFTFGIAEVTAMDDTVANDPSNFRTYYTQVEQKFSPDTTVSVRASYEEQGVDAQTNAGTYLGVNSSFPVTPSIHGGFQLRQRVAELISGAETLPETLLSFSLGGGF